MVILKELEVTVQVDGAPLHEYDDDSEEPEEPNTTTRYIEAKSGAEFILHFQVQETLNDLYAAITFRVYIDSKYVAGRIVKKDEFIRRMDGVSTASEGVWQIRKFNFSAVELTDDNFGLKVQQLKDIVAGVGTITIKVLRARKITKSSVRDDGEVSKFDSVKALPEKALKGQALSHRTSLGRAEPSSALTAVSCKYIDEEGSPYAVVHFKYRSRKALQDMQIIPRSPTFVPLEKRPVDELTLEEARELLRRRTVKTETKPLSQTPVKVKRERDPEYDELLASARDKKAARIDKPVETIDLLDD